MRVILAVVVIMVAVVASVASSLDAARGDQCGLGHTFTGGNHYCQPVERISYKGVGGAGTYNKITNMDVSTGACSSVPQPFSGPISPLDEDISIHFRGPIKVKQFAVFMPSKPAERSTHHRRHAHAKFHQHAQKKHDHEERAVHVKKAVGDTVTATINGQVVSWINQYDGHELDQPAATTAAQYVGDWVTATIDGKVVSWINQYDGHELGQPTPTTTVQSVPQLAPLKSTIGKDGTTTVSGKDGTITVFLPGCPAPATSLPAAPSSKPKTITESKPAPEVVAHGDWPQVAYYNSEDGTARGVTFLNNKGGMGSGVWDRTFGNSLSYASSDGITGVASPEVFKGELKSDQEIVIFSEQSCAQVDCGYIRPGSVAYKGFEGAEKAFFFEFTMPIDGQSGNNGDMPGIWALNAQIPCTGEFLSNKDCNCWASGCGEFDMFEVLTPGYTYMKSTLHAVIAGGSSDYFVRPTSHYMKAAVIFHNDNIVVQQLPDDFDINNASLAAQKIAEICDDSKSQVPDSIFRLAHTN